MQRDRVLLTEVIDAAERIITIATGRAPEDLAADPDRRDGLLWNYTVLGEAISQLSPDVLAAHPAIAWREPVRMRNRIVHGYWSVDLDVLIATAQDDLPALLSAVQHVQASTPQPRLDEDDEGAGDGGSSDE